MGRDYLEYRGEGSPLFDPMDFERVADFLEQSQDTRREQLEQELSAIAAQLDERDRIHRELVSELEGQIGRYTNRLDHLYTIGRGRTDGTREQLKDRLATFYRELRDEHRAHWRDRQDLEQERRDVRRELDTVADETLADLL